MENQIEEQIQVTILDDGEGEGVRRCCQRQCSYLVMGTCKACQSCGAPSLTINTNCGRCLRCENVPNELRFEDKENGNEM